ncbi:MAG: hypothetical protein GVY31_10010, partial [Alphaproteobacteria bacterium]|nr:hypothetical protein [Alphaproteobacteria bacterium]
MPDIYRLQQPQTTWQCHLPAYRRFIDEIVARINARNAKRIDAERETL